MKPGTRQASPDNQEIRLGEVRPYLTLKTALRRKLIGESVVN